MSLRPHANSLDVESIKNELNRPDILNGAVSSVVPRIAKKGLVHYMRQWFVSNEENEEAMNLEFNKLLERLTGHAVVSDSEKVTNSPAPTEIKEKKKEGEKTSSSSAQKTREIKHPETPKSTEKGEEKQEESNLFSKLYEGLSTKKEITTRIRKKLIVPVFRLIEDEQDKDRFAAWWGDLEDKINDEEKVYPFESLISMVNSGALAGEILRHVKSDKVNLRTIKDIIDQI